MDWNRLKEAMLEGFNEIIKNPQIIVECAEDTIEDADALVDQARPVLAALVELFEQVGKLNEGITSREISKTPNLEAAVKRMAGVNG